MKKSILLISTTLLISTLQLHAAEQHIHAEDLSHSHDIKPTLSIPIDHAKSSDDQPAFTVDVKGRIVNGVADPYNAYRHGLTDPGTRTWVGQTTDENARPFSMAWDAAGTTLYSINREEQKQLVIIDPDTLDATVVGNLTGLLPNQAIQGMAIDQNNTCFVITTDDENHDTVSSLYRCNLATGSLTLVGTQSVAPDLHDIVATCDDTLYGVDSISQSLYQVSKIDGSAQLVGSYGVNDDYVHFYMAYDRIKGDIYQYVLAETGFHTAFARVSKGDGSLTFISDEFRFGVEVGAIQSSCADRVDQFQLHAGFNGAWVNPAINGQGFLFEAFPVTDLFFAAWFTFDDGVSVNKTGNVGSADQRWVTASGPLGTTNVVELTLYKSSGGVFDDPMTVATESMGTATIVFEDCSAGTVTYEFDDGGLSGTFPIQRVAGDNIAMCEQMSAELAR